MSVPESILAKIKLLLNLANSPNNSNEAENAKAMAEKLIAKYNITEEELESLKDKKPLYGEDEKLYVSIGIEGWRQQLALAIGKHYGCAIVQEEVVPLEGESQFSYFAYGEPEDVHSVKYVFRLLTNKVEELMANNCRGRGKIYLSSYGEGVVESIRHNISLDGIEIPKIKKPTGEVEEEKVLNNGTSNLSKVKEEKEKPADQSVNVKTQSLIKDVAAYFIGVADGNWISLRDILELESDDEDTKELEE